MALPRKRLHPCLSEENALTAARAGLSSFFLRATQLPRSGENAAFFQPQRHGSESLIAPMVCRCCSFSVTAWCPWSGRCRTAKESIGVANRPPDTITTGSVDIMEQRTMRKVSARLIPFLIVCYFVAYLDRTNVCFAALTMRQDLNISATAYGLGAGIFFLSYFLFEVPSNLLLERFGARRWIARIMFTCGTLSGAMAFIGGSTASMWCACSSARRKPASSPASSFT